MIITWKYKYELDAARPTQNANMKTLLCAPRFPYYPSGHASMSGCSQVILSYFFSRERPKKLERFAYSSGQLKSEEIRRLKT